MPIRPGLVGIERHDVNRTRSLRIVLTCWGSYGDLLPYLSIATGLKARGHAPVLATSEIYREIVTNAGVEFHPVPPDVRPDDTALMARLMDPAKGTEAIVRDLLVPVVREAFSSLSEVTRDAELLVTHPITFAGPLVARALKVPWLSAVLAPASFFSIHDFPLLPPQPQILRLARMSPWSARAFRWLAGRITGAWTRPVRQFAAELGLKDAGDPLYEGQFSPHGTLALFSPVLGASQADWPPSTVTTGFVFHDDAAGLSPALRAFLDAGEPPVVFTLGTSAANAPGRFYEESARAAERLGRRAVLLVGLFARTSTTTWPAGVHAVDYAPHAPLFERAAAIVHHGGVGTLAQALRAGKPMLVVPHAHDQPDNAFRASRLGVARVLDARRYSAEAVAGHLRVLLDHPRCRARAAEVGGVVSGERGLDRACETILAACPGGARG